MRKVYKKIVSVILILAILVGNIEIRQFEYEVYATEGIDYLSQDDINWFTKEFLYALSESEKATYGEVLSKLNKDIEWSGDDLEKLLECANKLQNIWNKVSPLLPEKISKNEIISLGNNAVSYFKCTIGVLKNAYYINHEDANSIEKVYHYLDSFNSICSTLGWSLGPITLVLKSIETILPIADILYSSIVQEDLTFYEIDLQLAYYSGNKLPLPNEASVQPAFQQFINDEAYIDGLNALYIKYSLMRMSDEIKSVINFDTESDNGDDILDQDSIIINDNLYINEDVYFAKNEIKIKSGASLNISGDLHYCGANNKWCKFTIEDGGTLNVNGDFYVEGDAWFDTKTVELIINGTVLIKGNMSFTGYSLLTMEENSGYLVVGGNYKYDPGNSKVTDGTIVLNGDVYSNTQFTGNNTVILKGSSEQRIRAKQLSTLIINNSNGVIFENRVIISTLFNHNGNLYTLNNGGSFVDYDDDGLLDNVDPYPAQVHEWTITTSEKASCIKEGSYTAHCDICGQTKTVVLPVTGHDYTYTKTVSPTCTNDGYDIYTCTDCGNMIKENVIEASHHLTTEFIYPTCISSGYNRYTCSECGEVLTENVAKGKDITSSGSESSEVVERFAVDGDENTRWSSNFSDDAWICVDLGNIYYVNKVILNWEVAYGNAYKVLVSIDGNNWTVVKSLTNQDGGIDEITFDEIHARYVKIQGVERATSYGYSLWEMEVYCGDKVSETGHNYKVTEETNTAITYTCIECGDTYTEKKETEIDTSELKIKAASLSLESSMTMNFKVPKTVANIFEYPYMVFECNGEKETITEYNIQGEYIVFSYDGISPQMMNDEVTATICSEYNGVRYEGETKSLSVKGYVDKLLPSCQDDSYASLRTLLIDLLNYGAAAQEYMNYKTNNLVNEHLTDEQKSWATSSNLELTNVTNKEYKVIENPLVVWNAAGLILDNSVTIKAKFTAEDIQDLVVKVSCKEREFTYTNNDFVDNGDGTYYVYCNEIYADEMSENIFLTVYKDNNICSNTTLFSVESYVKVIQNNYKDTPIGSLTDAMIRYGKSAKKYGG